MGVVVGRGCVLVGVVWLWGDGEVVLGHEVPLVVRWGLVRRRLVVEGLWRLEVGVRLLWGVVHEPLVVVEEFRVD